MSYCTIAPGHPLHGPYHDREYGFPISDDASLFERLVLEINQAGLSWLTILNKRDNFRQAFDRFGERHALGLLEKRDQVAVLARGEVVEEAFVVIDEERWRALLGERRQADVFASLATQLDGLADDVGQPQPSLDLVQETFVVAHGAMIAPRPARVASAMERKRIPGGL